MVDAVEHFSRLVSGIYRAAIEPAEWALALEGIQRAVGAVGGGLSIADGVTRQLTSSNIPPEAMQSYNDYYHRFDYVVSEVESGPVGLVRTGAELFALQSDSEFRVDWMGRWGMDEGLFVRLTDGALPTTIIVHAPKYFETPERIRLLDSLVPHLRQAVHTQRRLEHLVDARDELVPAVDVVGHGIAVVRTDRRILLLNKAAERILSARDGLTVHDGRVEAMHATTDVALQRSIHRAFSRAADDPWGGSLCCARPSGKRPYVIHVLPLDRHTDTHPRVRRAVVAIVDPELEPEPPTALLRRLWGLTASEADVAVRIARGETLSEIADALTVSLATVRTHLQHVFVKTDTHRQAELVRLLLTMRP